MHRHYPRRRPVANAHTNFRHNVMAARLPPLALLPSLSKWPPLALLPSLLLLVLIMAPSTGVEGRSRHFPGQYFNNELFPPDDDDSLQQQSRMDTLSANVGSSSCYSCPPYRSFLFPKEKCEIVNCEGAMTCYKITAFVSGASSGSPPWTVHGCIQPSSIEIIRQAKAECDVFRNVAEKLDPDGGPAPGTTFNRCAIHTCENYAVGECVQYAVGEC